MRGTDTRVLVAGEIDRQGRAVFVRPDDTVRHGGFRPEWGQQTEFGRGTVLWWIVPKFDQLERNPELLTGRYVLVNKYGITEPPLA